MSDTPAVPFPDSLPSDPLQAQTESWLRLVDKLNVKAFVNLTLADSVRHGAQQLLFISGLGESWPSLLPPPPWGDKGWHPHLCPGPDCNLPGS